MKKKTVLLIACTMLLVSGCGKHPKKKEKASKSSASPKVTANAVPSELPQTTSEPTARAENPETDTGNNESNSSVAETPENTQNDISGNYLIISYEDASGNKETFVPGKDDSIIGSSSIALNKDGSCEFNMPGFGENTGCTWSGNTLQAAGAETPFTLNGNEMTIQENGETYVFKKGK